MKIFSTVVTYNGMKWVDKVFIQINNFGDFGKRNDIIQNVTKKVIFEKTLFWYIVPKYHFRLFDFYIFQIRTYKSFFYKFFTKL